MKWWIERAILYLLFAVLLAALEAGCTMVPVFHETGNPSDLQWWKTESRAQWRWYGAPVGRMPTDVYFATEAACEQFRQAHPTFTKPEEVCEAVRGQLSSMPRLRR